MVQCTSAISILPGPRISHAKSQKGILSGEGDQADDFELLGGAGIHFWRGVCCHHLQAGL